VPALCNQYGRCEKTVGLLRAFSQPIPRLWEALEEQERDRAEGCFDPSLEEGALPSYDSIVVLSDSLSPTPEIEELQEESCHFAAELVQFVPLTSDATDDEKAKSWTLPSIPAALNSELDKYTLYRTEPLNRERDGSCVVDITVGSDKATTLRFLGWLKATHDIVPGLGVFCRAALSQWAEQYAKALADKGLKYSSIANYLNGLAMVCQFVYQTYAVDAEALAMPTTPLDELLRLRGQVHSPLYRLLSPLLAEVARVLFFAV
jgi:hypothetical protein